MLDVIRFSDEDRKEMMHCQHKNREMIDYLVRCNDCGAIRRGVEAEWEYSALHDYSVAAQGVLTRIWHINFLGKVADPELIAQAKEYADMYTRVIGVDDA